VMKAPTVLRYEVAGVRIVAVGKVTYDVHKVDWTTGMRKHNTHPS